MWTSAQADELTNLAKLANLNHCAVLFLSRAAVNLFWYYDKALYYIFLLWWYIPVLEYYNQVLEYNNQLLKYYSQTSIIRATLHEYIFGLETADNTNRGADLTDLSVLQKSWAY